MAAPPRHSDLKPPQEYFCCVSIVRMTKRSLCYPWECLRIQQAIRLHEDLLTTEKRRKLHAVVWTSPPFIRSGQNHLARHSGRGKKTKQTEKEVGRQHQGMDRPGVRQIPEGSGEQKKMEETDCAIIGGAPTSLTVQRQMRWQRDWQTLSWVKRKQKRDERRLYDWHEILSMQRNGTLAMGGKAEWHKDWNNIDFHMQGRGSLKCQKLHCHTETSFKRKITNSFQEEERKAIVTMPTLK